MTAAEAASEHGRTGSELNRDVLIEFDVACPMRDGIILRSDVYRPVRVDEPLPVLLTRHPYGKNAHTPEKAYCDPVRLAQAGYIVVIQDVRGRFASGGEFTPDFQEIEDGYDAVQWASQLPGSNGVVGMYGRSYHAETQWAAARKRPTALKSIVPGFSPIDSMLNGFFMRGGAHELGCRIFWANRHGLDTMRRAARGQGEATLQRLLRQQAEWDREVNTGEIYWHLPLRYYTGERAPALTALACQTFRSGIDDRSWEAVETAGVYQDLDVTCFLVGGWYDVFLGSTLEHYAGMLEAAQSRGVPAPHLVIGPWAHNNVTGALGDEYFGLGSGVSMVGVDADLSSQHVRWFDAHLKGRGEALDGVAPVRVFVMGSNRWLNLGAFPPPETSPAQWYLHAGGGLAPDVPEESGPSTYVYDPSNPVPTIGGATLLPTPYPPGPLDQSPNDRRTDILRFDSTVLDEPLTLLGRVEVRLFAATSAPDTDFVARLVDIFPDGRTIGVADGIIRCRARETFRPGGEIRRVPPTLVQPAQPYEYTIDLWATARTFFAGHRIRVEITSSSFPRWDRNLNTGRDPFLDAEMQIAEQSIHHSPALPSHIVLPVYHGVLD